MICRTVLALGMQLHERACQVRSQQRCVHSVCQGNRAVAAHAAADAQVRHAEGVRISEVEDIVFLVHTPSVLVKAYVASSASARPSVSKPSTGQLGYGNRIKGIWNSATTALAGRQPQPP